MLGNAVLCSTTLSLILSCYILATESQASPVQTVVGSDANFSFLLNMDPGSSVVQIKDKNGGLVVSTRGNQSTSSNPIYSDRVNFTGNTNQKLISFILRNVTLVDAGMYNAVIAVNPNPERTIGSQMLIVKASPSKPQILELDSPAVHGSDYRLNCSTQSNSEPPNHNLSMLSEWRKDNLTITSTGRYIMNQTELTITGLNYIQDNMARLVCIAFEDQHAKSVYSSDFIIDVKYGPVYIQVNPLNGVITERENRQIIVNCTADCNPPCSYQWRKELVPAILSKNQTLIINNVSKNNIGRYQCYISNNVTGISQTAQIAIMIIYGPSGAQIMFSPSELPLKAEENTTVNIICSSDCYPDCNFTWSGPRGFFQMGSQLSRIVDRDEDGNYTCTATNQVNLGKKATVSATVIVLYGPGNSVNLGSIPPTIGVDLHQTASDITCNATCNPPCDYRWYQNGTFYRNGVTLSLGIVEKTTRGNYRCEAFNSVLGVNRSSSSSVDITVYYAPEVLLKPAILPRPSVYILKVGQTNVGLICVVIDASPPAKQFIWTNDGQEIKTQTNETLIIPMVTKDTMGRWGCKGVNSKGNPLESILNVDVHYGPIITKLPNITKVEGDSITVTCVVDSRPDPSSISWTKSQNNTFTQNKSEMYIAYLNRADKGTYECTAVNTIQPTGKSVGERITVKSSYILDVTYPPILTMKATNTSKGGRVVINCTASGVPDNYTFYKWTHMAPDESRTIVRELEVTRISGSEVSVTIVGATYQDTGFYVCKASNGITHYSTGQLIVEEMVSVWISDQPIITSNVRYFDAERGKSGYIHIEFYSGIIQPVITWYLVKNGTMELLQNSSGFGMYLSTVRVEIQYYQKTVQLLGYNASLEVFNVHEEQFTSYKVEINNSFAEPVFRTLELKPRGPPETPANLSVVPDSVTPHSLQLTWRAGFHGGASQTFVIEYREVGKNNWLKKSESRGLVLYVILNTTIADLKDGTKYEFRIYAENVFNQSHVSSTVNETTRMVPSPAESLGLPVAGLAGGISAGLGVIFIMGIGIVLWRRNQHKKQIEHDNDVSKVHGERSQMKSSSMKKDNASGKEYEGLHFKETEANQYLQLHGITLEENRNVDIRSPESDSYEQLHPYVNNDIQMYSSLNIPKTLKDAEQKYENTWIKMPDTTDESNKIMTDL